MKLFIVITMILLFSTSQRANALENAIPGRSLWGIQIGSNRQNAIIDTKRGMCFAASVQDDFLLTSRRAAIIIHRRNFAPFPIEAGFRGKRVAQRPLHTLIRKRRNAPKSTIKMIINVIARSD